MNRLIGTCVRGIRMPIFVEGDNLPEIVSDKLAECVAQGDIVPQDGDILAITESVVARAQGNYATLDQIAGDLKRKLPKDCDCLALTFPITSRNRFSILLKAFARAVPKIVVLFSYPQDEVGNPLFDPKKLRSSGVDPWRDVLEEEAFVEKFGEPYHPFTMMNYAAFFREIIEGEGAECRLVFANDVRAALKYSEDVLTCDIHTRKDSKDTLKEAGARTVLGLDDILCESFETSGFNEEYGLLGSNKACEESVKLFPRDCRKTVEDTAKLLSEKLGKNIEVMIYGDGAFKDPQCGIWELADPVVSPAYTKGLSGKPNEMKIKYLADSDYAELSAEEKRSKIIERIKEKQSSLPKDEASMLTEGTTPRNITDLLGSLCDLTSGSGDKGTPVVYIQGYMDNYAIDNA